jgi:hypothetical protein
MMVVFPIMTKSQSKFVLITLILAAGLAACNQTAPEEPTTSPSAVIGQATVTVLPPTTTPSPEPAETVTPEPTPSTTPVPRIRVSENSNCREGPSSKYLYQGVLSPEGEANVLGMNAEGDYWLISGEQFPEEGCWLWGEYAQVDGDIDALPIITPPPSPTPLAGFEVYLKDYAECGSTQYVVFAVKNVGGVRLWSGYIKVQDWESDKVLHQRRERHPFAANVLPVCPPGHGNELWPGETRYIHAPISPVVSGHTGIGIITLCPADHQGGNCVTEYSYFQLP